MARQKSNSVMFNTRGMFNRQVVFKVRGGRVNVSGPPNTNNNRVPTNPQQVYARSVCVSSRRNNQFPCASRIWWKRPRLMPNAQVMGPETSLTLLMTKSTYAFSESRTDGIAKHIISQF